MLDVAGLELPGRGAQDMHAHEAGLFLERVMFRRIAGHRRQDVAGADVGMAGERDLVLAGEDAHAGMMPRVLRRQDEGRLRQVELGGDRLHLRIRQAGCVRQHGQGIAGEALVGEDVDGDVVIAGHGGLRTLRRI